MNQISCQFLCDYKTHVCSFGATISWGFEARLSPAASLQTFNRNEYCTFSDFTVFPNVEVYTRNGSTP